MFQNIRNVLDTFEETYNNIKKNGVITISKEDEDTIQYFNMHLAKALMQEEYILDESVAKIILATRDLSSDIVVKVQ